VIKLALKLMVPAVLIPVRGYFSWITLSQDNARGLFGFAVTATERRPLDLAICAADKFAFVFPEIDNR
jgi:hypothetical protein